VLTAKLNDSDNTVTYKELLREKVLLNLLLSAQYRLIVGPGIGLGIYAPK
jgi:hypothetical protein